MSGDSRTDDEIVRFGPYHFQAIRRVLHRGDEPLSLGGRAFDILSVLLERAGEIISQREIVERVWPGIFVEQVNLRTHIANLRKALGDGHNGQRYIQTVPGRGYCFVAKVERAGAGTGEASPAVELRSSIRPLPSALPPPLGRMAGRDAVVLELKQALQSQRFVTLVGAGGVGKTTVAISAAHALKDQFDGAVAFVDLATLTDSALVHTAVGAAVGLTTEADNPLPTLLAFLRQQRLLIVFDNCEHVIDTVSLLAERIFEEAPRASILATSREALRVKGETVHLLAPLETPPLDQPITAEQALAWPVVRIFMERAAAGGHRSELADEDAAVVAAICSSLDGVALAVELAAGRVAAHGIRGTADLLTDRLKLHWRGRRSALPRHQTMLAMVDWSYGLLSDEDRCVLARLSIFIGPFTLRAAQRVVGDLQLSPAQVAVSLASLAEKSLVAVSPRSHEIHYRLLEITRSFASVKLEESGERADIALRHALHCMAAASGNVQGEAFPDLPSLISNLRSALEWSFSDAARNAVAVRLAAAAIPVFRQFTRLSECLAWCERALAIVDHSFRGTETELALLEGLAISAMFTRGNRGDISDVILRALEVARALGSAEDELRLLSWSHIFNTRIGNYREALDVARRGAEVAVRLGHDGALTVADWMMGASCHSIGDQLAANNHFEAALRRPTARPSVSAYLEGYGFGQRVRSLAMHARTLWLRGYPRRAEAIGQQTLADSEKRQHPLSLCLALQYAAIVALWRKDLVTAEELTRRLISEAEINLLGPFHAVGLALQGEVAVERGELAPGITNLQTALVRLEEARYRVFSIGFRRAQAEALSRHGKADEGLEVLDRAFSQVEATGDTSLLPDLLRTRAFVRAASASPDPREIERDLLDSIGYARRQHAVSWELRTAIPLARFWHDSDRKTEAGDLLRNILPNFTSEASAEHDMLAARALLSSLTPRARTRA